MRSSVDFPLAFAPTMMLIRPVGTSRPRSWSTVRSSYETVTPSTASVGGDVARGEVSVAEVIAKLLDGWCG